jgi:ribosome-associated protein
MISGYPIQPDQLAERAVDILSDRQAEDIALLDIRRIADFTDFFVIATADNPLHMNALVDSLDKELTEEGVSLRQREGVAESGWVLLDFGDLVVHIFSRDRREYYNLEGLWSRHAQVVRFT